MPKIARLMDCSHRAAAKLACNVVAARQGSVELAVRRGRAFEANIDFERIVTT
jgi:hypothetical protein